MKKKILIWIKRYAPAEIFGTLGALLFASLFFLITRDKLLSAYMATLGENIGFYGFLFAREILNDARQRTSLQEYGFIGLTCTLRNLFLEFGFSEILDSFIFRPFIMYFFSSITENYLLGITVGKIVADIIFYIPSIISYELRKKYL